MFMPSGDNHNNMPQCISTTQLISYFYDIRIVATSTNFTANSQPINFYQSVPYQLHQLAPLYYIYDLKEKRVY